MIEKVLAPSQEAQAEARDKAAFPRVVAAHHDDMARIAFVVLGLPRPSQDAAQAAWVKVWRERATVSSPDRLRPWVLGIAAKEARRFAESGDHATPGGSSAAGELATQASAARAYRSDELALANALAALDLHDRMILGLRWVGGLDVDAIGQELSMPGSAVLARVARILERWLRDPSFTAPPTETVEAYERALAARVRELAGRAVVEIDVATVAQTAIDTVAAPDLPEQLDELVREILERARDVDRRLWFALGGVVLTVAGMFFIGRGAGGAAIATPAPTDATRLCVAEELKLRVIEWQSAGDERIAVVEAMNITGGACLMDGAPQPWLYDGTEMSILRGPDLSAPSVRIGPGESLRTRVHAENYCGRTPEPPVTVAFRAHNALLVAKALRPSDVSGVPPCTQAGPTRLWMEAWGAS